MKPIFGRSSVSSRSRTSQRSPVRAKNAERQDRPSSIEEKGKTAISLKTFRNGIEIRNLAFFRQPDTAWGREFLARAFVVPEVEVIEINRRKGTGRIRYRRQGSVADIWRRLKQALTDAWSPTSAQSFNSPYLAHPAPSVIRINRVGEVLSTWKVCSQRRNRIRLMHPALKQRREVAHQLEEELTAVFGVSRFRINRLAATVSIDFRPGALTAAHLVRHLEAAWPRLLSGAEAPPSGARFFAATGMLSLAFAAQFAVPSLLPVALVAVAAYGFPNVIGALKLIRRGHVGLPVLYTGTLTFTLLSGMPFSASLMAMFMQWWPRWGYQTLTEGQRRLFANHRRRATWARLATGGDAEITIGIDRLKIGDMIEVQEGEVIPVDGVIVSGLAAVDEEPLTGRAGAFDKAPGDPVFAASYLRAGQIRLRVTSAGLESLAGHIGEQLPYGHFRGLPSSVEAEDVANSMVAPALAVAGMNLLLTGEVLPSQSTLRPDYATSPRLGAQLATLESLGDGLRRGVLFRDPAALDRLPATDIYIFDDSAALERRRISVGEILTVDHSSPELVLSYAASAFPSFQNERARSLLERCLLRGVPLQEISDRRREAGVISYRDSKGDLIQVVAPAWISAHRIPVPRSLIAAVEKSPTAWFDPTKLVPHSEPQLRPLWILRNNKILGVITLQRQGELEAAEVLGTLRARNPNARFLLISRHTQAKTNALASEIGISTAYGNLSASAKAQIIREFGGRSMWIGDGAALDAAASIEASFVSVSVGGAATITSDRADVVSLQPSLRALVPVRRLGRRHRKLLKNGYRAIFATNLFCLAGAFLGEFTTLTVALVSNFGTGAVFATHHRQINGLAARIERKLGPYLSMEAEDEEADEAAGNELESVEEYPEHHHDSEPDREIPV